MKQNVLGPPCSHSRLLKQTKEGVVIQKLKSKESTDSMKLLLGTLVAFLSTVLQCPNIFKAANRYCFLLRFKTVAFSALGALFGKKNQETGICLIWILSSSLIIIIIIIIV